MTTFADDFNRGDGALTSPWTVLPTFSSVMPVIVSNQVLASSHAVVYYAFYNSAAASANHFAQVTAAMSLPASNVYSEATLLLVDSNGDGYQFSWSISSTTGGNYDLYRITSAGGATTIDTASVSGGGTRVLRIEHDGTTVRCFADAVEVLSIADNTFVTDFTGLGAYRDVAGSGSVALDTWSGGDVAATPPGTPAAPVIDSAWNGSVHAYGTPPVDNGSPITSYVWQTSDDAGANWDAASPTAIEATIGSLSNGTSYTVRFAAVNAGGQGGWSSASSAATPVEAGNYVRLTGGSSLLIGAAAPLRLNREPARFFAGVDPVGGHLVDQFGAPWLCVGDTAWSIVAALSTSNIGVYVANRHVKRANAVIASIPEAYYALNAPNNLAGQSAFTGAAYASGLNDPYWDVVDTFLALCKAAGITVFLCPFYLGYPGAGDGWYPTIEGVTNTNMRTFAANLMARYPQVDWPNITWSIGHDRTPTSTHESRAQAFLDELRNVEGDTRPLIYGGVHPRDVNGTDTFGIGTEEWAATAALFPPTADTQYDYSEHNVVNADTMSTFSGLRWFMIEAKYELEQGLVVGDKRLRIQMWGPWASGASGAFNGVNPLWCFENHEIFPVSDTWQDSMDYDGSKYLAAFETIIRTQFPGWHTTVNDVGSQFVTNRGSGANRVGVRYDTNQAIFYHPNFVTTALILDLTRLTDWSTVSITRIDPVTGARSIVDASEPTTNATFSLAVPGGTNAKGDTDWLFAVQGVS